MVSAIMIVVRAAAIRRTSSVRPPHTTLRPVRGLGTAVVTMVGRWRRGSSVIIIRVIIVAVIGMRGNATETGSRDSQKDGGNQELHLNKPQCFLPGDIPG